MTLEIITATLSLRHWDIGAKKVLKGGISAPTAAELIVLPSINLFPSSVCRCGDMNSCPNKWPSRAITRG